MNGEHAEQELARLADAWVGAELRGDSAFLERTLTEDFIGVGPLGFLLIKPEWLARHQTGELKYDTLDWDEVRLRVYGEAAIMIGRLTQDAAYRGNPVTAQLRTTLVFVNQDGQWHLASLHFCTIGQATPFARP